MYPDRASGMRNVRGLTIEHVDRTGGTKNAHGVVRAYADAGGREGGVLRRDATQSSAAAPHIFVAEHVVCDPASDAPWCDG